MTPETTISMPILNPATTGRSQTFDYWGKVDLVGDGRAIGETEGLGTDGESLERYVREWNDAQT